MKKTHHHNLIVLMSIALSTGFNANASFMDAATETTQIPHLAATSGGWLNNAAVQAKQYATELNSLKEHITNNDLTRSIRGLNELQTSLQGDMSDVLGTVSSLSGTPKTMINNLKSMPSSVSSLIQGGGNNGLGGGRYQGVFDSALGTFGNMGNNAIGAGGGGNPFSSGGFQNGYDLQGQVGGLRTALNAKFLQGSQERQNMYKNWEVGNDAATNQVQLQKKLLETHIQQVKNQNRDQEMAALDRVQQSADRAAAYEEAKSKAGFEQYRTLQTLENTDF
jgi:hypothetical protein